MGTCQCEKKNSSTKEELKNFFTHQKNDNVNKINNDNSEINEINNVDISKNQGEINEPENEKIKEINNNNKSNNKLKDLSNLINARIINNFISKNLNRIYQKDKYNKLKAHTKSMFFEKEEINFTYDQTYFKHLFDNKLVKFVKNKDNIIKDLFGENFKKKLYSFPKLKEEINTEYNNYILTKHKDLLNEFISYGLLNGLIKKEMIEINANKQISAKNIPREERINLNKNFTIKKNRLFSLKKGQKNKKEIKTIRTLRNSKIKNNSDKRSDVILEEVKNNSFGNEKNNIEACFNPIQEKISIDTIIKRELDRFYDICFSSKLTFAEFQRQSILLKLWTSGQYKKILIPKLNNLINIFYYIYILKKYEFLSDTNKRFYKINPISIKRKSILSNKLRLNRKDSISKKDNILKMKILKGLFNNKNEDIELSGSGSSNSSQEEQNDVYSFLSTSRNNINKQDHSNNNKNNIKIKFDVKEEKADDTKSAINFSFKSINFEKKEKVIIQKRNSENITKAEYYNGQYDNTIYLYAGLGTLVNQNLKELYNGTFRYGKKEGLGIMYQIKEENIMEYFMGEFHQNKICGFGTKIFIINDNELILLQGIFDKENLIKGKYKKIILKEETNTIITLSYKGDLQNNKFSGSGKMIEHTYIYEPRASLYELKQVIEYNGEFFNNKKNGKGKEILKSFKFSHKNYKYEGNFVNDLKDGYGIILYEKSNFVNKYEGFFVKDKPFQIYGIIHFKSGDIYEGFFENGLKDNVGLYLFIDSKTKKFNEEYFGGFLEDYKDGIGRTVVGDSTGAKMLRGPYKKGDKEGQFEKVIYNINLIDNTKKRRNGVIEKNLLDIDIKEETRKEIYPKVQIKSFPIYEENEIIDINDNFIYDLNH